MLILDGPVKWNAGKDELAMIDTIASGNDVVTVAEDTLYIREMLSALTFQQQRVITATVFMGATEREVALKLGMSQSAVHQLKERALNRLRKKLYPG